MIRIKITSVRLRNIWSPINQKNPLVKIMTAFSDRSPRPSKEARSRNSFLARIFENSARQLLFFSPAYISRKRNIRFSRNVFPQRDAYLSMHLGGASPAFSYNSHAGKSTKRYRGVVKMRTSPALERIHGKSERKQSPECSRDEGSRQVYGVNCRHRPLL